MTFTGQRQGVWLGQNWRLRRSSAGLGGSRQYDRGRTWCCGRRASPRMPTSGSRKSTSPSSRTARSVSRSTRLPHPAALRPSVSRPGSTAVCTGLPDPEAAPAGGPPTLSLPHAGCCHAPQSPPPDGVGGCGPTGPRLRYPQTLPQYKMAERCGVRRRCRRAPGPFTQVTVFGYRTATADAATYGSRWVSLTRILAAPSGWAAAGTGLPKITAVVSVGHGHFYAEAGSSSLAPGGTPRARKSSSSQPPIRTFCVSSVRLCRP